MVGTEGTGKEMLTMARDMITTVSGFKGDSRCVGSRGDVSGGDCGPYENLHL